MTETDYLRYVAAFNARDYATLETFFTDDFALENAGFIVRGKPAFRKFYAFFHSYCGETVTLHRFIGGKDAFLAEVDIRFEGLRDLTPEVLEREGYPGMTPVPKGALVTLRFFIIYDLNADGLIRYIRGAVFIPAAKQSGAAPRRA